MARTYDLLRSPTADVADGTVIVSGVAEQPTMQHVDTPGVGTWRYWQRADVDGVKQPWLGPANPDEPDVTGWVTAEQTGDQIVVDWDLTRWIAAEWDGGDVTVTWWQPGGRAALGTSTGLVAAASTPHRGTAALATSTGLAAAGVGERPPVVVIEWTSRVPDPDWATAVDPGWSTTISPAWKTVTPPLDWTTDVEE